MIITLLPLQKKHLPDKNYVFDFLRRRVSLAGVIRLVVAIAKKAQILVLRTSISYDQARVPFALV